jgi:hypothetical protein
MVMVMPSNHSSIATCSITDPRWKNKSAPQKYLYPISGLRDEPKSPPSPENSTATVITLKTMGTATA